MKRGQFALIASALAAIIFVGLNIAAARWLAPARIDFTSNKLYTLSSSARAVVARLVEPVELELVYSRNAAADYPDIRMHGARVRELMNEIAARSGGKVRVRETDPAPFSEEEDRVAAAGVVPMQADGGDPVYLGVIGRNAVDDVIAIPTLTATRDGQLEYDLVRLVAQLDDPAPPRVAVISSLPAWAGDGTSEGDAFILREMRRAFEIVPVENGFSELPADADMLMIVHPPALNEWQLYLIDQFLMRKGRAFVALDPLSRVALATQGPRAVRTSSLGRLEAGLGVKLDDAVIADRMLGLPVEIDAGGGRRVVESQPLFIAAPTALLSKTDMATADLSRALNFGDAGRWVAADAAKTMFAPLVETTPEAARIAVERAAANPSPRAVMADYAPLDARQALAGRLSGELRTSFPDGAPPAPAGAASPGPHVAASQTLAEIVMVADADMLDDGFYLDPGTGAPMADNAAFVLNALDNLGGDPALVALRSRAPAARPMARVDALRDAASQRLYAEQAELEKRLAETEARLAELEKARSAAEASGLRLAREDGRTAEIDAFRAEALEIRGRLRAVERDFRRDIDVLKGRLQLFNVWLPPLVIAALGLAVFAWRSLRRRAGT